MKSKTTKIIIGSLCAIPVIGLAIRLPITLKQYHRVYQDENFTYNKLSDGTFEVKSCKKKGKTLTIPSTFDGKAVTSIIDNFILNDSTITTLNIPSSIKTIKPSAFMNCSNLTTINFISNVQPSLYEIGSHAFCGCSKLVIDELPSSLHEIGSFAFQSCRSIADLYIPNSVALVGIDAFNGCSNALFLLQSVNVPSGWNAKWNSSNRPYITDCDEWTTVYQYTDAKTNIIYNYLHYVNDTAYIISAQNYSNVSGSIEIPEKVTRDVGGTATEYKVIGLNTNCFASTAKNTKVRSIIINSTSELSLGSDCFGAFTCANVYSKAPLESEWITNFESKSSGGKAYGSLKDINLSASPLMYLQTSDDKAIVVGRDTTQTLTEIPTDISGYAVTEIAPRSFRGDTGLAELTFKCATCTIGAYAFYDCRNLKTITLDNVTNIGDFAFAISALQSLDVNGVTKIITTDITTNKLASIGKNAFEKAYYHKTTPEKYTEIETNIFDDGNTITTIGNSAFKSCVFKADQVIYLNDNVKKLTGYEFNRAGYTTDSEKQTNPVTTFKVSQALFNKMEASTSEGGWGWLLDDYDTYYLINYRCGTFLGIGHIVINE